MFSIYKDTLAIDYLKFKNYAFAISLALLVFGVGSLIVKGDKALGVDFTGGSLHQLRFEHAVDIDKLRDGLKTLNLGSIPIQQFGDAHEVIMKAPLTEGIDSSELGTLINNSIREIYSENPFEVLRTETVGPAIGRELRMKAATAALFAVLAIAVYVAFRFEMVFALGALLALFHDGIITLGLCSLFGYEISLTVIAAILTILGYSINDTIVIFDRIREERKLHKGQNLYHIINSSVNHTMNRTLITSLTTLLVALMLFLFGGEVIHDFSFAMLVGVIVGTYSSVYIASGVLILFQNRLAKG